LTANTGIGVQSWHRLGGGHAAKTLTDYKIMSARLVDLLQHELSSIPVEHWRWSFPCAVAIWRLVEQVRPGTMRLDRAGVDERGPYFSGKGVGWFAEVLWLDPQVEDLVTSIMRAIVTRLKDLPRDPEGTDSIRHDELPAMPVDEIMQLEAMVLDRVDSSAAAGMFA
jgi:hypothetical protein